MKPRLLLLLFILSALSTVTAQKPGESKEMPWRIWPVSGDVFTFGRTADMPNSFQQGIIYEGDTVSMFPVKYVRQGFGLVKMDRNANMLWELKLPGMPIGTSRLGTAILVICIPEDAVNGNGQVTGVLVDPHTGRKIKEKQIYQDGSGHYLDVKVQNNPDGSFHNLLVRTTHYEGKRSMQWNKGQVLFASTDKLGIVYLNEDLSISKDIEKSDLLKDIFFLGSLVNENQEILLLGHDEKNLIALKVSRDGVLLDRLETPIKTDAHYIMHVAIALDDRNHGNLLASLNVHEHDRLLRTCLFDFSKKTVLQAEPVQLNKSYSKSLELAGGVRGRGGDDNIEDLGPEVILQTGDKIIVVKEVRGASAGGANSQVAKRSSQRLVVSFYDRNLKLLKETGIDKYFEFFYGTGCSSGYRLKGDNLYLLTAVNTGSNTYQNLTATINLKTMSIGPLQALPESGGRRKFIEAGATLWFSNNYVLSDLVPLGISGVEANTGFEVGTYD